MSNNGVEEYIGTAVAIVCFDKDGPSLCVPSGSRATATDILPALPTDHEANPKNMVDHPIAKAEEEPESWEEAGACALPEKSMKILMATTRKRRETFVKCREPPKDVELLVEAGFYYDAANDCTRCYSCGGGLRDWQENDDVWGEHARLFPNCSHVLEKRKDQRSGISVPALHAADNTTILRGDNPPTINELLLPLRCKCCLVDRIQVHFDPCGHSSCYRCAHIDRNRPCYRCQAPIERRAKMRMNLF